MAKDKNVNVAKTLSGLTAQQSKELAGKINGGLGSGKPAPKKPAGKAKKGK